MKTLQELLKPPFKYEIGFIVDAVGNPIFEVYPRRSFFKDPKSRTALVKELMNFLIAGFNEKTAREWGEPKRWMLSEAMKYLLCPDCEHFVDERADRAFKYCPHCGVKLDPPESGQ